MFEFIRHTRDMIIPPAGHWSNVHPTTYKIFKAHISCPRCCTPTTINAYTVAPNGLVAPRFICQARKCGFSDMIKLQGWNRGLAR